MFFSRSPDCKSDIHVRFQTNTVQQIMRLIQQQEHCQMTDGLTLYSTKVIIVCNLEVSATLKSIDYNVAMTFILNNNNNNNNNNNSATSSDMKLVHWPLMGGLLHLVQR